MLERKHLLGTTVIAGLVATMAPSASWAQAQPTAEPAPAAAPAAPAAEEEGEVEALVVTGSRIKRTEFTSALPIQVLTAESASLEGLLDAAEVLQSSSVATGSTQINNNFTGFVVNGGGGVNTISLRGLGDNRTLVLMNGRRLAPAGTRGAVAAVDLNMLPGTAVQRYEVLKDGASSIYGSDAVAGVVNVLTRTDLDGWDLQVSGNATQEGGGGQSTFGVAYGKKFDEGHFLITAEYYDQKALKGGDRDEFMCQKAYLRDPITKARIDWYDVDTGKFKCTGVSGSFWGYTQVYENTGALRGSRASIATEGPGYAADPRWLGTTPDRYAPGYRFIPLHERNFVHPLDETVDVFSPVKRFTVFAEGAYDLGFGEAYAEFLFHNRQSSQTTVQTMFPVVAPEAPCSVNVFNCPGVSSGFGLTAPRAFVISPYSYAQDVDVYRLLGGLRGKLPEDFLSGNWTWDGYLSYSKNNGSYTQTGINAQKLMAAIGGDWWEGDFTGVCPAGSPAGCYPISLISDDYLRRGTWSEADYDYLKLASTGLTEYSQFIAEFQVGGDLFDLPAGPVGSAFGVAYRKDELNDQPGASMVSGNFYNLATAGVTKGEDTLWEAYGEVEAPLLRGLPGVEALTLNLSGRYSDYESYGTSSTYRVALNWAVNDAFRIRGTVGTSFRAPQLFELNLGDQGGFQSQSTIDPCINWADPQRNVSQTIQANCLADGIPGNYSGQGSSVFLITGGGDDLKAEESIAKTVGLVWTPSFVDLSVAIDYFEITVDNQITSNGGAVVGQCYASTNFPNEPFCDLFTRDKNPLSGRYRQILEVDASYRNIVSQTNNGLDLTIRYTQDIGPGRLTLDSQYTWTLEDTQELFAGSVDDFNGVIGEPSVTGSNQVRYQWSDWTVAWTSRFVGHQGNYAYQGGLNHAVSNLTSPPTVDALHKNHAEATWWHDIAIRYRGEDWGGTFGISNVFDERAPNVSPALPDSGGFTYGQLGTYAFATQYYDLYRGRSFFANITKSF